MGSNKGFSPIPYLPFGDLRSNNRKFPYLVSLFEDTTLLEIYLPYRP